MFLTADNLIKWKKMLVATILVVMMMFVGIVWLDKPLFMLLRNLDCGFLRLVSVVFDDKVWVIASITAAIVFCVKKCAQTDCEFLINRKKVNFFNYIKNFLVSTKNNNAFLILYSVLATGIVVKFLKIIIGRARPVFFEALDMTGFFPPSFDWAFNSMPSGHTAVSFAGLVMMGMLAPKYKSLTWSLAVLVALSRVAVGAHWPSDVLVGAFVGMVVADFIKGMLLKK